MSTAVTPYERASLSERRAYAETLAAAADLIPKGLWAPTRRPDGGQGPAAPSPGKILLVAETGAMLGLHPMAALQGIDVIEGKATISPQLMTGLLRAAGHKVRVHSSGTVSGGDYSVTVTLIRADDPDFPFSSTWDIHRAVRAGLCAYTQQEDGRWKVVARSNSGKALPWEAYPETMCKWRAIAEVGREGGDDVLKGITYTPEELGADVDEAGQLIGTPPEPSEDWAAAFAEAGSKEDVTAIVDRAKAAGEFTDEIRTLALTRYGMLGRARDEEETVDAEIVEEERDEDAIAEAARAAFEAGTDE